LKSIFTVLLALIVPVRHTPGEEAPNVRKAVAVTARRLRASKQSSLETGSEVRRSMRPIEELLKDMEDDREGGN
jgi:hypothetical protein